MCVCVCVCVQECLLGASFVTAKRNSEKEDKERNIHQKLNDIHSYYGIGVSKYTLIWKGLENVEQNVQEDVFIWKLHINWSGGHAPANGDRRDRGEEVAHFYSASFILKSLSLHRAMYYLLLKKLTSPARSCRRKEVWEKSLGSLEAGSSSLREAVTREGTFVPSDSQILPGQQGFLFRPDLSLGHPRPSSPSKKQLSRNKKTLLVKIQG